MQKPSIARGRLIGRLCRDSLRSKVTLIKADPGYGKTTLLRDFYNKAQCTVAWYTLDRTDQEPSRFARYFVEAVRRVRPGVAAHLRAADLSITSPEDIRTRAFILARELNQFSDRPFAIILDNFEKVNGSQQVASFVGSLIEFLPRHVHLFLGSREKPHVSLSRLRAEADLVEVGKEDLSLSESETRDLLVGLHGLRLDGAQVESLRGQTEGWVAGLMMVARAIRESDARQLDGRRMDLYAGMSSIAEYLAEEAFRAQRPEMQSFLLATSVLTLLHVDACNELVGIAEANEFLSRLEERGCFVSSVGWSQACFRYHPLFRDFLFQRRKASLASQSAVSNLHHQAARALEKCGHDAEAREQYLLAGEMESAADIVEHAADDYIERGQLQIVRDWFRTTPERIVSARPWLGGLYGKALRRSGDNASALHLLQHARQLFGEQGDLHGLAWATYELGIVDHVLGRYSEGIRLAEEMFATLGDDPVARAELHTILCYNNTGLDELAKAEQHGAMALKELGEVPQDRTVALLSSRACRYLAQARARQGMLQLALYSVERAMELCDVDKLGSMEESWVQCVRGSVLVLRGEKEMALEALQAAEDLGGRNRHTLWQAISLARGNALRDSGDYDRSEESYRRAGDNALVEMAFLRLRQERLREAMSLAQEAYRFYEDRESPSDQAISRAMLGIVMKARGLPDQARIQLAAAREVLQKKDVEQWLASVDLHLANLELNAGNTGRALMHLKTAMGIAARLDLRHFPWWQPLSLSFLVGQALKHGIQTHQVSEILRFELRSGHVAQLSPLLEFPDVDVQDYVGRILEDTFEHAEKEDETAQNAIDELLDGHMDEKLRERLSEYVSQSLLSIDRLARLRKRYALTWREIDVFCLYYLQTAVGQPYHDFGREYFARRLCMSENTLKVHVANIRRKLGLRERRNAALGSDFWFEQSQGVH